MKRIACVLFSLACSVALAQRLPDNVVPQHYTLKLTPDMQAAKFAGEESIDIRVTKPTARITLNALEITFQDVSVTAGGKTQKATVAEDAANETATLTVPSALAAGPALINLRYTGVLNDKLRGFYLAKTKEHNYAVTQFESTDARRAFPSFDEPALKATFDITVVAPKGDMAISNSKMVADDPGPGPNQHTVRFATSPIMSTYLVAVLVGAFQCIEGGADNIPIRVCTPPGKQEQGRFALTASENILKYFDQYFGIKYPYGKLDHIAVPDFEAGAMENVGAITYRDLALLVDDRNASVAAQKRVAGVIAHEMAHQWFGDLVTMQWWNDIWLNEGFATWMAFKPLEAWKPEWKVELDEQGSAAGAMRTDALQNTRPIRQQAETSSQIAELFDPIAYNKTAAVLRMVESYVGPDLFRQGINRYLQAHANANATAEDFWTAIAAASNMPADRIMSSFVNNTGLPVIEAQFNCAAHEVRLAQRRFTLDRSLQQSAREQAWSVPVCLQQPGVSGNAGRQCVLLSQAQQTAHLDQCSPSAFLNAGGRGYYRVNYAAESIGQLAPRVQQELSPVERLALVDNEWALVRSGAHNIGAFMNLADGLKQDATANVQGELSNDLAFITDYLLSGADRDNYENWVRSLLRPLMQQVGYNSPPNDNDERRELRAVVFADLGYNGRDPETLQHAQTLLQQYFRDPASVDPSMMGQVFVLTALQGTPALYDEFLKRAQNAPDPDTYNRYLFGLASFRDPVLIKRTLDLLLSPELRSQNMPLLFFGLMQNPAARDLTWQFVRARWSDIQKKSSYRGPATLVRAVSSFCDATAAQQVKEFFTQHPVPAAQRGLKQTLERINLCAQMKTQQQPNLAQWLSTQHTASGQ